MKTAYHCLGIMAATGLLIGPMASHAVVKVPASKIQSFKLDPNNPSFIDFGKLPNKLINPKGNKNTQKFGRVKFEAKANKPGAVLELGIATPGANGHTVSVEMQSLSLVSVAPISLTPFGSSSRGQIVLNLSNAAIDPTAKVDFPDPTNKKNGTFTKKLSKSFKVSKKTPGNKAPKKLSKLTLTSTPVDFTQQSPATVTAPFCLQSGSAASLCLAPLSAVAAPNTIALMGLGLGAAVMGVVVRRRRARPRLG